MKLGKIGKSYYIIIPKEIVERYLRWSLGQELSFEIREENMQKILVIKTKKKNKHPKKPSTTKNAT